MAKRKKQHICTCRWWIIRPGDVVSVLIQLYRLYTGQD
jgi:hypothetical protein